MAEGAAGRGSEAEGLSLQIGGSSRVLLRRFMEETERCHDSVVGDSDELELSLGLSLGGRFGTDPKEKRLVRSSSIAGLEMLPRDLDVAPPQAELSLIRTCSLPTETEEEWRKRKEMQSLRRLEAKRKRSEKQRNYRPAKDRDSEEEKRREEEGFTAPLFKGKTPGGNALPNGFFLPAGLPAWAARGADSGNAKTSLFGNSAAAQGFTPSSQGSLGSQGSSSSGLSDMDSRAIQGSSNCMEAKSPTSIQSLPERIEQKVVITVAPTPQSATTDDKPVKTLGVVNPYKKPEIDSGVGEMGRNVMEEMPCVSTRGDGPNGRRIEGFLYKFRKGEEVRIVCVCHGRFLSPAEFVRHAGGGDVAHPLRHIVVNPTPSSLL